MTPPTAYSRRILLAVTGLSPQIVTETLYALARDGGFVPGEIHLLTTQEGARLAKAALPHLDSNQFHALLADYTRVVGPDSIGAFDSKVKFSRTPALPEDKSAMTANLLPPRNLLFLICFIVSDGQQNALKTKGGYPDFVIENQPTDNAVTA